MTRTLISLTLIFVFLAACGSVPAMPESNCACIWEPLDHHTKGTVT